MARDGRARRRRTARAGQNPHNADNFLRNVALILLADAESPEEELIAIMILQMWRDQRAAPNGRYGPRGFYDSPKSKDFFDLMLDGFSERTFKSWMRMDRTSFWQLHELIKDNPIFQSTSNRPQRPVKHQLAAFLIRCGDESPIKVACVTSSSEGSVHNYVYRVGRAFRMIRADHLAWPGEERRQFLSDAMKLYGFPGCLGSADGSLIRLRDKPLRNPFSYWCRKKFYALVIQATVDHRGRFTSYDFGYPGSVQDSRIFKESDLWINRDSYFRDDEYIIVDKGYPLTQYSIRPFNDADFTQNPAMAARRKKWNQQLSSLRIFVEHAFGRLKGRFPILRNLPGRNIPMMCRLVEALLIIHNILESRNNDPTTVEGFNGARDGDELGRLGNNGEPAMGRDDFFRAGLLRRKLLVEYYETHIA